MTEENAEELRELLNEWLDNMMEVYGSVREEWEENDIVQPVPNAKISFHCSNCGKCCDFSDHWVWVYCTDLVRWIQLLYKEKNIPLFLGILFPVQDMEDAIGYGLPSQRMIVEKFTEIKKEIQHDKIIHTTLDTILKLLHEINPHFDEKSDFCIFYNPQPQIQPGHCMIYKFRPLQCQTYPYDFPQFTQIRIPDSLADKYGALTDDLQDLPACNLEAFDGDPRQGVLTNEEERENVLFEKVNYLTSILTQSWQEEDMTELLLELFHRDILNIQRSTVQLQKGKDTQVFVAGKRPDVNQRKGK